MSWSAEPREVSGAQTGLSSIPRGQGFCLLGSEEIVRDLNRRMNYVMKFM